MFNNSVISTSNVGNLRQILADVSQQVSVGCIVPQSMGVQVERRKIVKAGTPLHMDYLNPFEPVTKPGGGGGSTMYEFYSFLGEGEAPQYNKVTLDAEKFSAEITRVCNEINPSYYPSGFACGDWVLSYVPDNSEWFPSECWGKFVLTRGESDAIFEQSLFKIYTYDELVNAGITISNHDDMQDSYLLCIGAIPAGATLDIEDNTSNHAVSITGDKTVACKTLLARLVSHDFITNRTAYDDTRAEWLTKLIYADEIVFTIEAVRPDEFPGSRYKATMKYLYQNEWHDVIVWQEDYKIDYPLVFLEIYCYSDDTGEELASITVSWDSPYASVGDTVKLTITHEGSANGNGESGGGEFNAVLLHDVDVTLGANNGTALLCGVVNLKRVENDVREEIESNLESNKSHVIFIRA